MRSHVTAGALALVLGGVLTSTNVAGQNAQPTAPVAGLTSDEQLIIDFFGFTGSRGDRAARFMTPDYVQHNPRFLRMDEVTGAKGNQAWVAAADEAAKRGVQLVALPGIALRNPVIVMKDGPLVHAIYRGTRPDPTAQGATYEVFAFESFRIRDGKFSEHWDQVRLAPGWMMPPPAPPAQAGRGGNQGGGRGAAPAPVEPQPTGCTATPAQLTANKRLASSLFERTATPETVRARLTADFIEHSPRGLLMGPTPELDARSPRVLDHTLAECDYVSIVWKQTVADPDTPSRTWEAFTFDAFRVRGDRISEHWNHEQR